jgi:hypothetical protein
MTPISTTPAAPTNSPLDTADELTSVRLVPAMDVTYVPRKIEELLARTTVPLHRAILKNFLRHALLEISGYWDQILVPELTVGEPAYRISERGKTHVLTGKEAVLSFYRQVFETRTNVMGARAVNMAVGDFGVVMEAVFGHFVPGTHIRRDEIENVDHEAYYLVSHHINQNFAYTSDAKLIGERVYDDPASYEYLKLDPADVVTPELARERLAPYLDRATLD